jgi:hypothetical protein
MCLRFKFCTHQRVCVLNFLKKVKFLVPYWTVTIVWSTSSNFYAKCAWHDHVKVTNMEILMPRSTKCRYRNLLARIHVADFNSCLRWSWFVYFDQKGYLAVWDCLCHASFHWRGLPVHCQLAAAGNVHCKWRWILLWQWAWLYNPKLRVTQPEITPLRECIVPDTAPLALAVTVVWSTTSRCFYVRHDMFISQSPIWMILL